MVQIISYVLNIQKNDYYFLLGHKVRLEDHLRYDMAQVRDTYHFNPKI